MTKKSQTIAENSHSLWMDFSLPTFPPLKKDMNVDICIVGAGIVGLTCAYTLAKAGKSVVVLDQSTIAGGETARTTAHLTWALDDRYFEIEKLFGLEQSTLAAISHSAAIDYIEKIVFEEKIDCDFERVDGYLFSSPEDSPDILNKEYSTIKKTKMPIKKVKKAPLNSFNTGLCLQFPDQAQFHILKYLQGLVQAILKYGGKIFCHTHVNHLEDGKMCFLKTESGNEVIAQSAIVATCTPVNNRYIIHTKQAPYRTYVIAATVPKGSVHKGLYWDTSDPYHYIRIQKHETDAKLDWLIIGGEDHKTGQNEVPQAKYDYLEEWARERFPMMIAIEKRWSGQVFEPVDALAFIGRNPKEKNIYIATGDSGNGMTHGTIAGMLIPDLILGKANLFENLYDPSRKTVGSASEFIKENLNVALQYKDWFTADEAKKIDDLPIDEGLIVRKGIKKLAVYKDIKKEIHVNSAVCPHLGGCVRWNEAEKSWDCPCHGSRFDGFGNVLCGPTNKNLTACHKLH